MADFKGSSIVDFLKSTSSDSSFSARKKLAVEQGIVRSDADYRGTAEQNTSLLNKLRTATPETPAKVGSTDQATDFINAKQDEDIDAVKIADEPPVRDSGADLIDVLEKTGDRTGLVPDFTLPDAPNFEQSFSELRQQFGTDDLESTINDLDLQEQDLQAQLRTSKNAELGKTVALGVIGGRVGEQERNFMERIEFIGRQKTRAINELNSANDTIENMMDLRKLDYDTAKDKYDTEFSQNIQLFNTVKSAEARESTEEDRIQDNARANLQIIHNSIKDGSTDLTTLDDKTRVKINKLELQAGLPQGFYQNLSVQNPDGKVLSTTTRTTNGVKYADVIFQNEDGSISTKNIQLGASGVADGEKKLTEAELKRSARGEIATQLNTRTGDDGYTSPDDYKKARSAWVSKGFSSKDFDESFSNEFTNPEHLEDYGLSIF